MDIDEKVVVKDLYEESAAVEAPELPDQVALDEVDEALMESFRLRTPPGYSRGRTCEVGHTGGVVRVGGGRGFCFYGRFITVVIDGYWERSKPSFG